MLDLDALLDTQMDSVALAPNYVEPENGIYVLTVNKVDSKKVEAKDGKDAYIRLIHEYSIQSVKEQEGGLPVAEGSLFQDSWMATEAGLPHFKSRVAEILVAAGMAPSVDEVKGLSLREMLEAPAGLAFQCVIRKVPRAGEGNEGRFNIRINNIQPA